MLHLDFNLIFFFLNPNSLYLNRIYFLKLSIAFLLPFSLKHISPTNCIITCILYQPSTSFNASHHNFINLTKSFISNGKPKSNSLSLTPYPHPTFPQNILNRTTTFSHLSRSDRTLFFSTFLLLQHCSRISLIKDANAIINSNPKFVANRINNSFADFVTISIFGCFQLNFR